MSQAAVRLWCRECDLHFVFVGISIEDAYLTKRCGKCQGQLLLPGSASGAVLVKPAMEYVWLSPSQLARARAILVEALGAEWSFGYA